MFKWVVMAGMLVFTPLSFAFAEELSVLDGRYETGDGDDLWMTAWVMNYTKDDPRPGRIIFITNACCVTADLSGKFLAEEGAGCDQFYSRGAVGDNFFRLVPWKDGGFLVYGPSMDPEGTIYRPDPEFVSKRLSDY